ncbi:FAD-dependent monooxygenase [Streptomyces tuirus]|uniref:FAD-dependent monooxygenase n=1 Tax=Streptomyces tuirus TaxID=68278 RepID=A0A941FDA8_9ACTN|nr:FAD-dependent monooxygenase [Streptomyces tuirus]
MRQQVVIVGGGPVGSLLAHELALQGARAVVLERAATPSREIKAGTLHARTAQLLDRRGLLEEVALSATWAPARFHFSGSWGWTSERSWTRARCSSAARRRTPNRSSPSGR